MLKRTIEISGIDTCLSMRYGQIFVRRNGDEIGQFPAEDIGLMIVDTPTAQYTHGTLLELVNCGAAVVLCGENHLPSALIVPCESNSLQTERIAAQVTASLPLRKRLWKQLIKAKVENQAENLEDDCGTRKKLLRLASEIKSGDPSNIEAQASRAYWQSWLGDKEFHRRKDGEPPNNLLNYGYAVLRAAVARAITGAGLHPSVGLHHHNRYDAFCLADDLMEPMRPLVDRVVRTLFLNGIDEINKESKKELLSMLLEPVEIKEGKGPLFVELEKMATSLVACYMGESEKLSIPRLI